MRAVVSFLLSLLVVTSVAADPVRITGTDVQFTVTKLGFADVVGHFREFNADIQYNPSNPEQSVVRWRVRVGSVETGRSRVPITSPRPNIPNSPSPVDPSAPLATGGSR